MADIEESSSSSSNSNAPGLFKLFGKTITVEEKDRPPNSNNEETSKEGIAGALPCPRCKSKDTKFCYFNNYNVNQPRHFCRSCHRYWTAGGTLRNVPKGAGRRKTRSSPRATSPVKLSLLHE
ncbi:hypothetical protein J5N97_019782 [Dioscorea zingiberensis]|uniref:Dof-type domain-containing protein n=1 Tax=Dioscorea zingiberensis TaxID=325984 RepID=A0A9D5HD68_9LILI|nr:hypothetical protein J5N97_019782 [Dioscorea zingiberensis]